MASPAGIPLHDRLANRRVAGPTAGGPRPGGRNGDYLVSGQRGQADEQALLHPIIVTHLRILVTPGLAKAGDPRAMAHSPFVFRWIHDRRELWEQFALIQTAGGI
jgi:hypothetical protein